MLEFDDVQAMSPQLRETVNKANWKEALGKETNHSYSKLIKQNRQPAIAARMISRPTQLMKYSYDNMGRCILHGACTYTAEMITGIIINSVRKNADAIPYPLTGDWSHVHVKQLYLFIRGKAYARFKVTSICKSNGLSDKELMKYTDPTPIKNSTYKSIAYITDVETSGLPDDFLGNSSGISIKDSALKGSRPLIYIL